MAWYHRLIAKILRYTPGLAERWTLAEAGSTEVKLPEPAWCPLESDPFEARTMLVTTGGVYTSDQPPFDMSDSRGDTSFRWIPRDADTFHIRHDYYDHSDADRDINCLFPLPLAHRLAQSNRIGPLTDRHLSFMGHIEDALLPALLRESLPRMWEQLEDRPQLVVLSPA